MVLAFRLYGNFLWPPAPKLEDAAKGRRPGSVEVYYAEKNDSYRAYARWVPKGRETEPHDPPAANALSAYDKTIVADKWFADEKNACKPIWIDGPATKNGGVLAVFRGAHLLLQSESRSETLLPTLTLPLVRECKLGNETFHSAFTLTHGKNGNEDHPRFDLDLNLYLPAARTTTDATAVFPLRAVFYPWDGLVPMGRVGMLVAKGTSAIERLFDLYPATAFRALGQFGLAACGGQADDFAILCEPAAAAQSRPYWPGLNTVAANVLAKLGLQLTSKPKPEDPSEIWHARLRFGRSEQQGLSPTTLIYHLAFRAPSGASLKLKGAPYPGDTFDCGDRLHVDVALSWADIVGDAVHHPASWAFDVHVSLVWPEVVKRTDFAVSNPATLPFGRRLLVRTARRATLTRESLQHVEGAQPVSLLPDLGWPTAVGPPSQIQVYFALYAAAASTVGTDKKGLIVWAMPAPRRFRLSLADPSHLAGFDAADVADCNALPLRADLPGFVRTDVAVTGTGKATGLRIDLRHDPSWPPRSLEEIETGEPYLASFAVTASQTLQAWTGRVGGLQFEGRGELTPNEDLDFLRTAGWGLGRTHAEVYPECLSASLRLSLSVTKVTPVSADVARQDRSGRPAPLLIDLVKARNGPQGGPDRTPFVLRGTETFADDRDRLFTASLFDNAQEKDERDYLILAEEPFSILRFAQVPLGALGDAGTTEVAVYSSDDRLWQYRLTAQHYHYILPPQVIGESADKPRRLELHDLLSPDGKTIAPPYADEGETGKTDPQKRAARDLKRRAVEFRLTPSTEIWIAPSDVARGYFMPEQASYEIFRQRGEYGPVASRAVGRSRG